MTISNRNMTKAEILARLNALLSRMSRSRLAAILNQLEEKPARWKRRHNRRSCFLSVDYDTESYSSRKYIRNLSVGGVYIEAGESFAVGQELLLWFSVSEDDRFSVKIPGRVVRRDPDGIGVKFENLTAHQKEMIEMFEKMDFEDILDE